MADELSKAVDQAHELMTAVAVRPVPILRPATANVSKCRLFSPVLRFNASVMAIMPTANARPKPTVTP